MSSNPHEHFHHAPSDDALSRNTTPTALADEQARLRAIIDSAMDAIITVDEEQTIVMFNRAAARIFGYNPAEAVGMSLEALIPSRSRGSHAAHLHNFGRTGVTERSMGRLGTIFGLRSDGKEFPIEASISHAMVSGPPPKRFYTVILRDTSEKHRLEAQLLQAQKMEGIGRLAGGVAHDFNNLLMAMFNYLALASRQLDPQHPARAHLAHAHEAAERAASLTRQLLAFARKQAIHPRVISPREVVTGIEPMLRRMVGEDLTLRTVLSPDTWNVLADASQLEQVLMNLAVNARDAMPRGGTITIETTNIVLDGVYCRSRVGATPGEHVQLTVSDSGTGMPADVLEKLFEPFFTTKPPGKGSGLGLATCHGIVSQHGGHIAIYSEPGHGTSVKVFLPRAHEARQTDAPAAVPPLPKGGSEVILLAEDSEMVRELAVEALRGAGYTVLAGQDGRRALALANRHVGAIDLLVSDVVMPEMNGVQLAEALLQTRPDVKLIFMSGYTEETIGQHGVAMKNAAFLAKPFMTDVLLRKVREVLDAAPAAR